MVAPLIKIIGFTLLVIEILVGIVVNGFIVLVNFIDWFKSRKLSPPDLILTCLSLSRLVWQIAVILYQSIYYFSLCAQNWKHFISILWAFSTTTNVWFATWLSVFYFAKIANFSHPIFLQVKQRISGLVPWLLLGSGVLSAGTAISVFPSLSNGMASCNFNSTSLSIINDSEIQISGFLMDLDIVVTVPNSVPFLIFLSSSILLIISLWKHTRRLQHNGIGTQDLNTQAHLTAIKSLASFSVLFLSSFLALVAESIFIRNNMDHTWPVILINNVMAAYPSGHAVILILINPKLKQTWVRILHHLKCC